MNATMTSLALGAIEDEADLEPIPTGRLEQDWFIDRHLQRLTEVEAEKAHNDAVLQRYIDWRDEKNAVLDRRAEYIRSRIREAILGYEFESGKKSRELPNGKIGRKTVPAKLIVEDAAAVIQWAKDMDTPDFIRTKTVEEIAKQAVNGYWASTGEVIPGTRVEGASEKIIIEPSAK